MLLRSADVATYHAKNRGGNTYEFFNSTMNSASTRRLTIETRMRRALEREEFSLVYQPIRNTRAGQVSAVETLIRWTDSEGEMIGPDEFIPIAEETGLIVEIGAWMLRTACQQAVDWQQKGFNSIRLSVNISVEQLRDLGIANTVDQVLYDTGLSAADLELTESSILDESPNIIAAISQLTNMGIEFALAKRLEQSVVAEGVETEEQARFLTSLGCDELQGDLFSRPLPPDDFEAYLRREEKDEVAHPRGPR